MTNFHAFLNSSSLSLLILGAGLALGGGLLLVLFFLIRSAIEWVTGGRQVNPSSAPVPTPVQSPQRRTLTGLSWIIAHTHRSVSQTIGLVMSISSLIAIVLSVVCAIAGIAIISYEKFHSLLFSGIAAVSTLILATLIESLSINALKSIRIANESIAQAEQAHYDQVVKQMEVQFEEDAQNFAKLNQQNLSKEDIASMKRAANFKRQARKQFEKKRHALMRQQTRNSRHTRNTSIPFAAAGVLFSASAGGLFWHTVLVALPVWLNLTIGTMFALVVSVTFVQSELLKRIKDDAIAEALQSGEMQSTMLKQQSSDMVLEMVVDTMAVVKQDPNTLVEMGTGIKEELKTTIRTLTKQATSRLIEGDHPGIVVESVPEVVPQIEEKAVSRKQKKEPDWCSHPALDGIVKRHPKMHLKINSWRSAGRFSVTIGTAIETLIETTGQSRKMVQRRVKDGTLEVSRRNPNLVLIRSILDWLECVDALAIKDVSASQTDLATGGMSEQKQTVSQDNPDGPITESIPVQDQQSVGQNGYKNGYGDEEDFSEYTVL